MEFFRLLSFSLENYGQALRLLGRKRMWLWLLYPLFLNLFIFGAGIWAVAEVTDVTLNYLQDLFGFDTWASQDNFFQTILYWILWFVFKVIYFILFAFLSGNIILILMSPALALLSEQTEKLLTGTDYPFIFSRFLRETVRGIGLALRNMLFQFALMAVLFILGFIPFVGALVPIALLLVSSYFYGFSFLDYYHERRQVKISESVRFMRQNKGLAVGNGLPFALLLLIPLFGSLIASFFSVITVIAGTYSMHSRYQQGNPSNIR